MLFIKPARGLGVLALCLGLVACAHQPSAPTQTHSSPTPMGIKNTISQHIAVPPASAKAEREARRAAPQFQQALANMAQQKPQEAQQLLEALAQEYPRLAGPLVNLGLLHLQAGNPELAEQALEEALKRHPHHPYAHGYLGVTHTHLGHFKRAESHYLKAIALAPQYEEAHKNLGILYELYLQQPQNALKHYQQYQALQADPDPQVAEWISLLQQERG